MEFKNKNDYSIIVFSAQNICLGKMEFVHSVFAASLWLSKSSNYSTWHYINVYVRRSGRYLRRYYNGNFIDNKPK
jgi:hypothetical protein